MVILLGSAVLVTRLRNQYDFPRSWDNVHAGMTRSQVVQMVGKPDDDMADIKGCFWFKNTVTGWQELHVFFENDHATDITVTRFLGNRQTFMKQIARIESDESPTEMKVIIF